MSSLACCPLLNGTVDSAHSHPECAELQRTQSSQWPVSCLSGPTSSIPGLQIPGFRVARVELPSI